MQAKLMTFGSLASDVTGKGIDKCVSKNAERPNWNCHTHLSASVMCRISERSGLHADIWAQNHSKPISKTVLVQ